MGLPSHLLWASANVGSNYPSGSGLYFSWGNTDGHAEGSGFDFSPGAYNSSPAASIVSNLSLEQDMARANLGDPWRMPTDIECEELYSYCTVKWTTLRGVPGALFTSNVNGNWLFFPSSGRYVGISVIDDGRIGFFWSSTFANASNALRFEVSELSVRPKVAGLRHVGLPVRAVYDPGT